MLSSRKVSKETAKEIEQRFGKGLQFTISEEGRVEEVSIMLPNQKEFIIIRAGTCYLSAELVGPTDECKVYAYDISMIPGPELTTKHTDNSKRLNKLLEKHYPDTLTWGFLFLDNEYNQGRDVSLLSDMALLNEYSEFHRKQMGEK